MKTIFDNETVIGRCSKTLLEDVRWGFNDEEWGTLCVQSSAHMNGTQGLMRLEQRCYMRLGEEVAEQPWVKPELRFETVLGSEQEAVEKMKQFHEEFVCRARALIPEGCLV